MALNTRAKVIAGDLAQVDKVRSGGSYLSRSDLRLHFGLGDHRQAERVEISWPSGATEELANVAADRLYCVKEGAGIVPCAGIRTTGTYRNEGGTSVQIGWTPALGVSSVAARRTSIPWVSMKAAGFESAPLPPPP